MGWDGAGAYNRQHNFSADASAGIKILAARMDAELDDVASAMTIALTRNGQNVPTANLPMGGFRHINVGAPVSVNNYMRSREFIENVPIFMDDTATSADRISVSAQYFTSVSANQPPGDGTRILVRVLSDKSSSALYLNGHSANVEFQDGNRANAAMVSGGIYEMLFSSVDAAWKVTNPSIARTAAERSASVTPINYQYEEGVPNRYATNTIPGTTDMTAAVQAAISVMSAKANGGNVRLLEEDYGISSVTLAHGVYIVGTIQGESLATSENFGGSRFVALATGDMVKTSGTLTLNCGVVGVGFLGLGAGTALNGVHFDNVKWGVVRWCAFNNFADHAILADSDCVACTFQANLAVGCLLDTTRAAKSGVLDIDGSDHRVLEGEYNTSITALTDANAYCGAVVLRGGNHFVQNVVGELSDFGIATIGVTAEIRLISCRADQNYGNGFEISDSTRLTNCHALRNGQQTTNTYDGFLVTGGSNSFCQCEASSTVADGWVHRYGFRDQTSGDGDGTTKNHYDATCKSVVHGTAAFSLNTFAGAARMVMHGSPLLLTAADTTPTVANYGSFRTSGALTITDLTDGTPGQEIVIYIDDATTFDCTGTNLTGNGGADIVAAIGDLVVARTKDGTTWRLQHIDCTA